LNKLTFYWKQGVFTMPANETAINGTTIDGAKVNGANLPSPKSTPFHADTHSESGLALPEIVQLTLSNLTSSLRATLALLQGPLNPCLESVLHDPDRLPDANGLKLAAEAVDLLGQTQKLLDPGPLILADHFLGELGLSDLQLVAGQPD
jgi:hypothetical protein